MAGEGVSRHTYHHYKGVHTYHHYKGVHTYHHYRGVHTYHHYVRVCTPTITIGVCTPTITMYGCAYLPSLYGCAHLPTLQGLHTYRSDGRLAWVPVQSVTHLGSLCTCSLFLAGQVPVAAEYLTQNRVVRFFCYSSLEGKC